VPRASVGLAWASPPLALAWPLASCKFQCVCGFAAAFGCRRPAKSRSVQINMFIRMVVRLARLTQVKYRFGRRAAKPLGNNAWRNAGKRANFSAAKNLPFCSKKTQNSNDVRGRKDLKDRS